MLECSTRLLRRVRALGYNFCNPIRANTHTWSLRSFRRFLTKAISSTVKQRSYLPWKNGRPYLLKLDSTVGIVLFLLTLWNYCHKFLSMEIKQKRYFSSGSTFLCLFLQLGIMLVRILLLVMRPQLKKFGKCGIPLHYQYFPVNSDPEK